MTSSTQPGSRDPFAAFACDDPTLDALRAAAGAMGFAPEKCLRADLRGAVQSLSVAPSPAILVIDLSECSDPLNEIVALEEVCEPGTVVIALGRVNDVRLYRQLIASGIHDYLLKPVAVTQLSEALTQARTALAVPRASEQDGAREHTAIAVVGTRGGVGASTLATSLAWLFGEEHKRTVALLDLDVHFGTAALSLDLEPGRGLIDAIADPGRIDGLFLERAMTRASERLAILSAEAPIGTGLTSDGEAFVQLEREFRQAFDMTVIDLPRSMLMNFPQVLAEVKFVILVAELTLASARDTIRLLSWLHSHAPEAQPVVVANKVAAGSSEIGQAEFEASIEQKIGHSIFLDTKSAIAAAKFGQSLAEAGNAAKTGATLRAIAASLASGAQHKAGSGEPTTASSLLARLDWKALLNRKQAAVPARSAPAS